MTAETATPAPVPTHRLGSLFLGFGTAFRKEVAEWVRGRRALIVGGVSIAFAALATIIPFIVPKDSPGAAALSMDPTFNVLAAWNGLTFQIVALLATMSLISTERDRGTLGWNLTNPVSRTSILAAKWAAAMVVYGSLGVFLPIAISSAIGTVVYGAVPELGTVGLFALLYLTVPAFYIGLMVALGTGLKATAGIAGIGFLIMFLPSGFGALLPIINEVSPTSIGAWAMATATGAAASVLTIGGWIVAMLVLVVGAKVVFDRQEF
jgi:ABC-type transport system involved in multi-copper enzyme maturation permease subunit